MLLLLQFMAKERQIFCALLFGFGVAVMRIGKKDQRRRECLVAEDHC
jgi:hypothetical protein